MKKLLIGTHNPAKQSELLHGLMQTLGNTYEYVTLTELGITGDPVESGDTYEENAFIKAEYYYTKSGIPTIVDDGGIMIDALDGEPGVHSKRWLGRDATDQELIDHTLLKLKGIPDSKRTAHFVDTVCYFDGTTPIYHTEEIRGKISTHQYEHTAAGFPYRALFVVDGYNRYYDELTPDEHRAINHRLRAVAHIAAILKDRS